MIEIHEIMGILDLMEQFLKWSMKWKTNFKKNIEIIHEIVENIAKPESKVSECLLFCVATSLQRICLLKSIWP